LLDLMRDPTRDTILERDRCVAKELLVALESGNILTALIAPQVSLELGEHANGVQKECHKAITKLKLRLARIDAVASVYGSVGSADLSHLDDHAIKAREIVDRWIRSAQIVQQPVDVPFKALNRVNMARTPASKGKDSMKDCVVIETYLDAARSARQAENTRPIVFLSSNVRDYTEGTRSRVRDDLAEEFARIGIEYAPSFGAAWHFLSNV